MQYRTLRETKDELEFKLDDDLEILIRSSKVSPHLIQKQLLMSGFPEYLALNKPDPDSKIMVVVNERGSLANIVLREPGKQDDPSKYCGFFPARKEEDLTPLSELARVNEYLRDCVVSRLPPKHSAPYRTFTIETEVLGDSNGTADVFINLGIEKHEKQDVAELFKHFRTYDENRGCFGYQMKHVLETAFLCFGHIEQDLRFMEQRDKDKPDAPCHTYIKLPQVIRQKAQQLHCMLLAHADESMPENTPISDELFAKDLYLNLFLRYPKEVLGAVNKFLPHRYKDGAEKAFGVGFTIRNVALTESRLRESQ